MLRARVAPNRKYSRQPKQLMNWYRAYLHDAHFSLQPLLQRQSIPVFFIEFAVQPGGCFIFYPAIGVFWLTPVWVNLTSSAESCQHQVLFLNCAQLFKLSLPTSGGLKVFQKSLSAFWWLKPTKVFLCWGWFFEFVKFILEWMYFLLPSLLLLSLSHKKAASASHPFGSYKPVSCL